MPMINLQTEKITNTINADLKKVHKIITEWLTVDAKCHQISLHQNPEIKGTKIIFGFGSIVHGPINCEVTIEGNQIMLTEQYLGDVHYVYRCLIGHLTMIIGDIHEI